MGENFFRVEGLMVKTATSKINTSYLTGLSGKKKYWGVTLYKDKTLKWLRKELKKTNLESK
jgi:hypothetical protein